MAQVARGGGAPLEACLGKVDPQYAAGSGADYLEILRRGGGCCGVDAADMIASGPPCTESGLALFRDKGRTYDSHYCADDAAAPKAGHVDHHPSLAGMYLNALVMFATLFGRSPIGAAWPDGQLVNGEPLPLARRGDGPVLMSAEWAAALQRIAHKVVLDESGRRRKAWERPG